MHQNKQSNKHERKEREFFNGHRMYTLAELAYELLPTSNQQIMQLDVELQEYL